VLRELPVTDLMVTDVTTFTADQNVQDAMRVLVTEDVDAGPVVDENHHVIGLFSTGDVIVEEARLHLPTIVNFLGVNVALPWHDKELDESVAKALGEFVGDVMTSPAITIRNDATIEDAATLMHDEKVSRLPVVNSAGRLVGLLARGDIVRAIVLGLDEPDHAEPLPDDEFTEMLEARVNDLDAAGDADTDDEQG
jgi:CBS domain-containing protein